MSENQDTLNFYNLIKLSFSQYRILLIITLFFFLISYFFYHAFERDNYINSIHLDPIHEINNPASEFYSSESIYEYFSSEFTDINNFKDFYQSHYQIDPLSIDTDVYFLKYSFEISDNKFTIISGDDNKINLKYFKNYIDYLNNKSSKKLNYDIQKQIENFNQRRIKYDDNLKNIQNMYDDKKQFSYYIDTEMLFYLEKKTNLDDQENIYNNLINNIDREFFKFVKIKETTFKKLNQKNKISSYFITSFILSLVLYYLFILINMIRTRLYN